MVHPARNVKAMTIVVIAAAKMQGLTNDQILYLYGPDPKDPWAADDDAKFDMELKRMGATFTTADLRQEVGRVLNRPPRVVSQGNNNNIAKYDNVAEAAKYCIDLCRRVLKLDDAEILATFGPKAPNAGGGNDEQLDAELEQKGRPFRAKELRAEIARLLSH